MPSFAVMQRAIGSLLNDGQPTRATQLAHRWNRTPTRAIHANLLLAQIAVSQNHFLRAVGHYDAALSDAEHRDHTVLHNRAVALIDGAIDKQFSDNRAALTEGVKTLRDLENSGFAHPDLYYNLANGMSAQGNQLDARRCLHTHLERSAAPRPEAWVNLANSYRCVRRYSEAIDLCLEALALNPVHDMAWATLANAFTEAYYATAGQAPHLLILSDICCNRAEIHHDGRSRAPLSVRQARQYVQEHAGRDIPEGLSKEWEPWFVRSLDIAHEEGVETFYRSVAVTNNFTLDLFHGCPHPPHPLPDPPLCRAFIHQADEQYLVPEWYRILNAIHWEYHAARTAFVRARRNSDEDRIVERLFEYVDVRDDANFTSRNRHLLECVSSCMNIFDKIGLFLNSYYRLGKIDRQVYFSGKRPIVNELQHVREPGTRRNLDALVSMSDDLENSFFRRAMECRHSFTHRYVIPRFRPSRQTTEQEHIDTEVPEEELSSLAKNALRLAKGGIYYTVGIVVCRNWHLEHGTTVLTGARYPFTKPSRG